MSNTNYKQLNIVFHQVYHIHVQQYSINKIYKIIIDIHV